MSEPALIEADSLVVRYRTVTALDALSLSVERGERIALLGANGSGKSRSSRDGTARKAARWRVLFLSSGEIGLADKVAEDGRGRKLAAGQQVRIVDISAEAGAGMGRETLTVVGATFPDGKPGFYLLADRANIETMDRASSETLLDHDCAVLK